MVAVDDVKLTAADSKLKSHEEIAKTEISVHITTFCVYVVFWEIEFLFLFLFFVSLFYLCLPDLTQMAGNIQS